MTSETKPEPDFIDVKDEAMSQKVRDLGRTYHSFKKGEVIWRKTQFGTSEGGWKAVGPFTVYDVDDLKLTFEVRDGNTLSFDKAWIGDCYHRQMDADLACRKLNAAGNVVERHGLRIAMLTSRIGEWDCFTCRNCIVKDGKTRLPNEGIEVDSQGKWIVKCANCGTKNKIPYSSPPALTEEDAKRVMGKHIDTFESIYGECRDWIKTERHEAVGLANVVHDARIDVLHWINERLNRGKINE